MATITVSQQDVDNADVYLTAYLKGKIPDADFSKGSVVRDFVVTAIAHIFAFLRAEVTTTRNYQSLLALQQQPSSTDVDAAVDAILSNLFITRNAGVASRVAATLHFSALTDVVITPSTRFFRNGQSFTLDATDTLFIPRTSLQAVLLASGAYEYLTVVPLVCTVTGSDGDVPPGKFSGADQFNPYFSYAENLDYGLGGKGVETTADLISRAPTALSVRNLVNVKSIKSVLQESFPEITANYTAGFGDAEMTRDRATEGVTGIDMHVGGHMDVYVKLPIVTQTDAVYHIGDSSTRADGLITTFTDTTETFVHGAPPLWDYGAHPLDVRPGDVLYIRTGLPTGAQKFLITAVSPTRLYVADNAPFPVAASNLTYSIGSIAPNFNDKRTHTTVGVDNNGQTSGYIQKDDCVYLLPKPKGKLRKVEVSATGSGGWSSLSRVNTTPGVGEYTVIVENPAKFQSNLCVERLETHAGTYLTTPYLRVTYDALAGYDAINTKVTNTYDRNVCANNLAKGYIPVYIGVLGNYALSSTGTPIDATVLKNAVATFLHDWDVSVPLDVSAVTTYLRSVFPSINRFYDPVYLYYTLYMPDGQLYQFQTTDVVSVFPDDHANVSLLTAGYLPLRNEVSLGLSGFRDPSNPSAFAVGKTVLQGIMTDMGVSNNNVRYIPDVDVISLTAY